MRVLAGYSEAGWIRHSSVSTAMVIASLQKDGKGNSAAGRKLEATVKEPEDLTTEHKLMHASRKATENDLRTLKVKSTGTCKT